MRRYGLLFVAFNTMAYQRTCQDHSKSTEDFGESLKDEYTHNLIGTKHTFSQITFNML